MRGVSLYYIHGVKAISQVKTPIHYLAKQDQYTTS
jgi:hypothetical protein